MIRVSARAAVLAIACLSATLAAQQAAAQAPPGPRFNVASLKERDRIKPIGLVGMQATPGRLFYNCATLRALVHYAFRVTSTTPIEGLPGWASTPCADGDTANTYEFQATMPAETSDADARLMLQAFLVERFKLAFHREKRTLPIYALVVAPGGLKVKSTDPKDDKPRAPGSLGCPANDRGCRIIAMGSAPMRQIADALASNIGRPVIDKTGLSGTYYFDLKYAGDSPESSLPSLPAALKEQFGLELKAETGPVEVLVIDRAEKPTAN